MDSPHLDLDRSIKKKKNKTYPVSSQRHKLKLCLKRVSVSVKELEDDWQVTGRGLLTELAIHKKLLIRIQHQFRSSKVVHRCQAIQSCARRLSTMGSLDLRSVTKGLSFSLAMAALLQKCCDLQTLMVQLATYSELAAEASTQCLAQEHYFFFGSDVSILAVNSRIWVIAKALQKAVCKCETAVRNELRTHGVNKELFETTASLSGDGIANVELSSKKGFDLKKKIVEGAARNAKPRKGGVQKKKAAVAVVNSTLITGALRRFCVTQTSE